MRRFAILIFVFWLCLTASAQSRRSLLGKLVKGDDQSKVAVANAAVVLNEPGSHDTTDPDGLFSLFLPDLLRPGDEVTVSVTVPGYAIYDPPGGKVRIPSDFARTRIEIRLLPKGSMKFFSDSQLRALVERGAGSVESSVGRAAVDSLTGSV